MQQTLGCLESYEGLVCMYGGYFFQALPATHFIPMPAENPKPVIFCVFKGEIPLLPQVDAEPELKGIVLWCARRYCEPSPSM